MVKIIRVATVPSSLFTFCKNVLRELKERGYDVVALSSPGQDLVDLGKREGVDVVAIPMERHMSLAKDLMSLCKMIKTFLSEKPNMVHSMTPKAGLISMIASWVTRVPVRVHTFTGLVWPTETGMKRRVLMATDWVTCACATHVIPEGQGVMEDLQAYITKKPMKVLGYGNIRGVDMEHYSRRSEVMQLAEGLKEEGVFTFLFIGRIVKDKGINELAQAFDRLRCVTAGKVRLILVGPYENDLDPVLPETRKLIESAPEIVTPGTLSGDELLTYYAAADCFVFPSYREGFPNTVLEAGALEVPSIVTDINGSSEIIINTGEKVPQHLGAGESLSVRENGVMIPSKNVDALCEAMLWMMEHPDERKKMGKRAREIVAERWEQGFVREKLFEFYREVLGE